MFLRSDGPKLEASAEHCRQQRERRPASQSASAQLLLPEAHNAGVESDERRRDKHHHPPLQPYSWIRPRVTATRCSLSQQAWRS